MALGERFRGGGTRGIARFLADHQHCDAGFDVRREAEPGSGRLRITCLGCGQTIAYKAAEAGEFAATGVELNGPNGGVPIEPVAQTPRPAPVGPAPVGPAPVGPAPVGPAPGGPAPGGPARGGIRKVGEAARRPVRGGIRKVGEAARRPAPARPEPPPRRGLPGWIPMLLTGALIIGGLTMIAIGLTRSDQETGSGAQAPPAETQPTPAQEGTLEAEQPAAPAPAPEGGETAPAPGSAGLQKRTFGQFEIGVPSGWRSSRRSDAVTLRAAGAVAAVRVVTQQGEFSDSALAEGAANFLAAQHPDAQIGEPDRVRIGGRRATRVRATYRRGTETAFALSAGGHSFLIGERVERGASPEIEEAAGAAVESFEPR